MSTVDDAGSHVWTVLKGRCWLTGPFHEVVACLGDGEWEAYEFEPAGPVMPTVDELVGWIAEWVEDQPEEWACPHDDHPDPVFEEGTVNDPEVVVAAYRLFGLLYERLTCTPLGSFVDDHVIFVRGDVIVVDGKQREQ